MITNQISALAVVIASLIRNSVVSTGTEAYYVLFQNRKAPSIAITTYILTYNKKEVFIMI